MIRTDPIYKAIMLFLLKKDTTINNFMALHSEEFKERANDTQRFHRKILNCLVHLRRFNLVTRKGKSHNQHTQQIYSLTPRGEDYMKIKNWI